MAEIISEEVFTEGIVDFLNANARLRVEEKTGWGEGSDKVGLLSEKAPDEERKELALARAWRQKFFDADFGWITGPTRYGGRALPASYDRIWQSLSAQYDTPSQAPFWIGLGMIAPTILAHATDKVKDLYLRALYRGDIVACQLFSEPGAGSDLASLQTQATQHGDEWIVNGQKVWTSGAHYSDIGEIICRTDSDAPKHQGLTAFVVNMRAPGVEIRPLRQMTGGASFNEVFLTDVHVHDHHRLGEVNQGWTVALTTLMNERATGGAGLGPADINRLAELLQHFGKDADPLLRQRLAEIYIHQQVARYTNLRAMQKMQSGQLPGPEMSIAKLSVTNNLRRISDFLGAALGPKLMAESGEWGTFAWADFVLGVPGMRLAGGTDEVMKNIISERVLGLPKEKRT
jgi:alkylation response protein AidB-like acyl-CoA dehydrogenase